MHLQTPGALFVDDDPNILAGIAGALHRRRFRVLTAGSAADALALLAREPVAVVVSDEHMPVMSGTAFLSEVRRRHPQVIRMVLSGAADARAVSQAINQAGVFRYLLKPCTPADLTLAVEQGLEAHAVQLVTAPQRGVGLSVGAAIAGLHMVMQPIYDCRDGGLLAHEALLRVDGGLEANVDDLLDAAVRGGRLWEVERAVRSLVAKRMTARPLGTSVFVNLHPNSLLDPELFNAADPLARYAPSVVLEITERGSLGEIRDLPARLEKLRALGYRLAVDDMGSGYSGFNAFAIQPDFVKFDRALIQSAKSAQAEYKLVSSIAAICRELGIKTVAEGVEDQADLDAVRSMSCTHVQGYLLARPSDDFRPGPYAPAGSAV